MASIHRLSALRIDRAQRRGYYGDGGGLYMRIGPTGAKSWVFRYKVAGRTREMGLGPLHTITLAEARDKAREARKLRLDDRDPIDEKRAARAAKRAAARLDAATAMTFRACAEGYVKAHEASWRSAVHRGQWRATLETYAYPVFGDLPVQAVDTGLVMKVLEPIWLARTETASRLRGRIEAALAWATVRGHRTGDNPARWRNHLDQLLPQKAKVAKVAHHAALAYGQLPEFYAALRAEAGSVARALEFTILTAARTGEVLGARWEEFDVASAVWTIPADRMKAGREHRVALSEAAAAIVDEMQRTRSGPWVFPGQRATGPLSGTAMLMLLRGMAETEPRWAGLTTHGFRSTFSDWVAERTNYPSEVREMALAHAVGNKVEAAYRRGDLLAKRHQLAEEWARFCLLPPADAPGKVLPIRVVG